MNESQILKKNLFFFFFFSKVIKILYGNQLDIYGVALSRATFESKLSAKLHNDTESRLPLL